MTEQHKAEIKGMTDFELAASIRIVSRQVNAPFFVGDREDRIKVLEALNVEKKARGY